MKNSIFCHLKSTKTSKKTEYILLITTITLTCIGLLFVYSASYYTAEKNIGNKYFYLLKQAIGAIVGFISMFVCSRFSKNILKKTAIPLAVLSVVLLILVLVPGIGVEAYGARRWIGIGGFTFQPSEIAKFSLVLFVARYIESYRVCDTRKIKTLFPIIFLGGLYCVLIILEPNMSITVCMGLLMMILLFIAGISIKNFILILLPLLCMIPVLIFLEPYRMQRLLAFLDPWANPKDEGYQLIQSLYALGSGGWFGVGIFNSRQKYSFLPFAESDFVFSVIGEELGLLGCFLILLLFVLLIFSGVRIAINSTDQFDTILAGGVTAVIAVQTAINLAVVTGMIPPTGLPLPFISFGGTSLTVFLSAIGVLWGINRRNRSNVI